MEICGKNLCLFFKFRPKKIIGGTKFRKKCKKFVKVQVSTIHLNQKRSNTYNRSIENKIVAQNILAKSKCVFHRMRNNL